MVSKELMKNRDRLERIELIREVRRKLGSFPLLLKEEKAMALKALNDYEEALQVEITRNNNLAEKFLSEGISHDIEVIKVPHDENRPSYKEFESASDLEGLDANIIRMKDLSFNVPSLNISDAEKRVFLEAIKDYCNYLKVLQARRKNNADLYKEETKTINPQKAASIPTMSQSDIFNDLYANFRNSEKESSKAK